MGSRAYISEQHFLWNYICFSLQSALVHFFTSHLLHHCDNISAVQIFSKGQIDFHYWVFCQGAIGQSCTYESEPFLRETQANSNILYLLHHSETYFYLVRFPHSTKAGSWQLWWWHNPDRLTDPDCDKCIPHELMVSLWND